MILRVEGQRLVSKSHLAFDVVRWEHARVSAESLVSLDDFLDAGTRALERALASAEGRTVAVRVEFTGSSAGHSVLVRRSDTVLAELRRVAVELGGVYLEEVVLKTKPNKSAVVAEASDAVSEMLSHFARLGGDPEQLAAYESKLSRVFDNVPSELRDEVGKDFSGLFAEVLEELSARLAVPEGEA
jgi:hypothetical protein